APPPPTHPRVEQAAWAYGRLPCSLRRVERVLAPLEELLLQLQARLVPFYGAGPPYDRGDPRLGLRNTQPARRRGAVAGVVVGEARVPPDAGVEALGQRRQPPHVGAGLLRRAIEVHQVGPGDQAHRRLPLAGVHVRRWIGLGLGAAGRGARDAL